MNKHCNIFARHFEKKTKKKNALSAPFQVLELHKKISNEWGCVTWSFLSTDSRLRGRKQLLFSSAVSNLFTAVFTDILL